MAIALLVSQPIDSTALVRAVEGAGFGAIVTFSGNVRDFAQGKRVLAIEYSAYNVLAASELQRIADEAQARGGGACALAHRIGPIPIGEASVFIAVSSAHRAEAFDACRWAIDAIKTRVPIWKRETYDDGVVWVEGDRTFPI